jgi:hypothetical protein
MKRYRLGADFVFVCVITVACVFKAGFDRDDRPSDLGRHPRVLWRHWNDDRNHVGRGCSRGARTECAMTDLALHALIAALPVALAYAFVRHQKRALRLELEHLRSKAGAP